MTAVKRDRTQILLTLGDHALWSVGSLAITVLVGRLMGVAALGTYAIATSAIYSIASLHNSLIAEPAAALGPNLYSDRLRWYAGRLVVVTLIVSTPFGLAGALGITLAQSDQAAAVWAGIATAPAVLLAWTARRLPYLDRRVHLAFMGSGVNLFVSIVGILAVERLGLLTVPMAIYVSGVSSLAYAMVVLASWRPSYGGHVASRTELGSLVKGHWDYGRWLLGSSISAWVGSYGLLVLIGAVVDVGDAGGFRAAQSLVTPLPLFLTASSYFFIPRISELFASGDWAAVKKALGRLTWIYLLVAGLGFFVAVLFGRLAITTLFGSEFEKYVWVLGVLAGLGILQAAERASSVSLQALLKPRALLPGMVSGAILAVLGAVILGPLFGLGGIVSALALGTVVRTLLIVNQNRRALKQPIRL